MFGSDDITWCASECDRIDCFRHQHNMMDKTGLHSFAYFKGTPDCVMKIHNNDNVEPDTKIVPPEVTTQERGWVGHFCCGQYCLFRRNTLVTCGDIKWIVSTVGNLPSAIDIPELGIKKGQIQTIGADRWYETMVFESLYDVYDDADVTKQISFESDWGIFGETFDDVKTAYGENIDLVANEMHDTVVEEMKEKIKEAYINAKTSHSL